MSARPPIRYKLGDLPYVYLAFRHDRALEWMTEMSHKAHAEMMVALAGIGRLLGGRSHD